MILNTRDLYIASAKIGMLTSRCDYLSRRIANQREADSAQAELDRMQIRIDELSLQLRTYKELVDRTQSPGDRSSTSIQPVAVDAIAEQLIKRRIRIGLDHLALGQKLGTSRQMIARYERIRYACVSLKRIIQIDAILRTFEQKL